MDAVLQYINGWSVGAFVCLMVGLGLIIFEMFTPGVGVPGVLGICALVAALILRTDSVASFFVTLAIVLVILVVSGFFIYRSFKKGRISKSQIVLKESVQGSSSERTDASVQELIGHTGVCLTALRPSGNADFDGSKLDVVSDGDFIAKGAHIRIERIDGLKIVVKEVKDEVL